MKLYVGNLPRTITSSQLNDLAVPFGTLKSADVVTERGTGESRGFGFVEFASADEARAAITALDGKEIDGKIIKVNEAKAKEPAGSSTVAR